MAKVFAIANQKGGVGKTTTCINLAASLVATKRRVLLIDLDPQGNATMGSGIDKHALENSIYDVLIGECDLAEAMQFSEHGGYQLLPANRDLTAAEVALLLAEPRDELGAVAALRRAAAQTDRQRMRTGKTDIRELWAVLSCTPMLRPREMAGEASRLLKRELAVLLC